MQTNEEQLFLAEGSWIFSSKKYLKRVILLIEITALGPLSVFIQTKLNFHGSVCRLYTDKFLKSTISLYNTTNWNYGF